ncbi:MAG: 23S rRNA (guanosine(2251)-2'-O)-methyltransferase RlmB [bacterium]
MNLKWVVGINSVTALLDSATDRLDSIWVVQGQKNQRIQSIIKRAGEAEIEVVYKPAQQIKNKVETDRHQGIIACWNPPANVSFEQVLDRLAQIENPLVLVLEEVTDPGNLGACLRVADAAGADVVIKSQHNSASMTPIVWKTSAGAAATIPVCEVSSIPKALKKLQNQGMWSYGLAGEGSQSIYSTDLSGAVVLVMGSEGNGLKRLTREHCDFMLSLPMLGQVESLNVSVATGIALYEVVRQRTLDI